MADLTMADVLEHYGADLSRVLDYGWRKVKCPFHDDKIASASVNLEDNAYACHACDVHGDVLNTIARAEGFGTIDQPDRKAANEWAERILGTGCKNISRPANETRRSTWRDRLFA